MADKKKSNVSETFGKYAQNSSGRGGKVAEPKNITSDMWTPISAGETEKAPEKSAKKAPPKKATPPPSQKKNTKKKKTAPEKKAPKQPDLISEGRKKSTDKKNSNASGKKPVKRSRIPKGRPVSEIGADSRQKNAEKIRNQQKLSKAERDYDDRIREGKSPGELSKERAGAKRKKRIRHNVIVITLFLVFALAFVGIYTYTKGAPAEIITVEGDSIYTHEQIIAAAELETGVNMLSVREEAVNESVRTKLPYIHSVKVKRKLPDKLILTVTPTTEKYILVNKKESIALDSYGKVLCDGKGMKLTDGLYRVYGVGWDSFAEGTDFVPTKQTKERYDLAVRLVTALEKEGVILKATVNVSDTDDVKVYCVDAENELMIYLGSCSDLESRVALVSKVMRSPEASGKTGYIDVRFNNAYFKEGSIYLS